MGANEPCWCGSGLKWKRCHRERERQEPIPIGKLLGEQHAEFARGVCLHPEAGPSVCGSRIIRAHTVQRNGGLSSISEDGHVISIKRGFEDIFKNEGEIVPRKIGVHHASTFMGFCGTHDDQLFAPVEKAPINPNAEAAFLLSFRAICYELFAKQVALRTIEVQRQLDRGKDFEVQCYIQQLLHLQREGMKRGLHDLAAWKRSYDEAYRDKSFTRFPFVAVVFAQPLPVVTCGAFYPEFDFGGNPLQIITRGTEPFEHVSFNLTSVNGKSIAVLGSTGSPSGPAEQFVNSYRAVPWDSRANASFHLACEYLENSYFRPSWWNAQPDKAMAHLVQRFRSGIGTAGTERNADCLSEFRFNFVSTDVEHEYS
jgi:SEC-C motif